MGVEKNSAAHYNRYSALQGFLRFTWGPMVRVRQRPLLILTVESFGFVGRALGLSKTFFCCCSRKIIIECK